VIPVSDEHLRALLMQTRSISRLVDQLNTLSLAGTANFVSATTVTDLALHVSETVSLFQASAGDAVVFRTHLQAAPAMIDPDRFRQGLLALLDNVRKYAGSYGPIDVYTGVDDADRSFVSIQDKGPGLSDDVQHSSFDMFWRSERLNGRGSSGSGLGLTVVKAIAEGHNAKLQLGNNADGGAFARIIFASLSSNARY
jgi:two-component system sensor histidine kinase AdeS